MRHLRLAVLIVALVSCVGASECSGSGSGGGRASADSGTGVIDPPGSDSEGGDPAAPTPEPGGALLFGLGTLIAAAATRRRNATRA